MFIYQHRKKVLATGRKEVCEVVMRRDNGSLFYAHLESLRSGDDGLHTALIDLTEHREMEDMLQKKSKQLEATNRDLEAANRDLGAANRDLGAANRDLEAFAYSTAHDLRTPLRTINIYSKLLLKNNADQLEDEGRQRLNAIRDNAQKLSWLINDLLSFARVGHRALSLSLIDMENLARQVSQELLVNKGARSITVKIDILPQVYGDPMLVTQVLSNLVANAIKFTGLRAEARIKIGGREEEGEMVYYVRDNGIGFNMDYENKLFQIFERLHNETDFEGSGVGLAIVQRIIDLHGGRVWAEGKVHKGATFYFTLPKRAS